MRTRTFRLDQPEVNQLQAAYLHARDANTKIRYQAVRLYGTNYPVASIGDICACSRTSLMEWVRAYRQHGLSALVDQRRGGNRACLQPQQLQVLQNQLHRYTPAQLLGKHACVGEGQFWTVPDVAALLERDYALAYQSLTSYRTVLAKCGFSYQRPAKQYKSHSDFKRMQFEELLEKNS